MQMQVDSSGVSLHVEVTGPDDGTAVVLLHGFPDTGRLWSKQVPALVEAGYRVIVPTSAATGGPTSPPRSTPTTSCPSPRISARSWIRPVWSSTGTGPTSTPEHWSNRRW